jgi:hypothetical protein
VPASLGEVRRAPGVGGRRGRVVTAVALTLSDWSDDLLARLFADFDAFLREGAELRGGGLRGGSWALGESVVSLRRLEFVPGVRVSSLAVGEDVIRLRVDAPRGLDGRLSLHARKDGRLDVRGVIGGRRVNTRVRPPARTFPIIGVEDESASAAALDWPAGVRDLRSSLRTLLSRLHRPRMVLR